ncbi:hypothetical protein CANMA_000961 [Candida margitis]|uniref:uncharacterized protein n=1 Tax=Candida margitis TaxID=1775924 RepID=UPI0022275728|nr:uncharacterized protein CANMA_000961 [Candida margitis]KAI5969921.1 hypothetical protein CANMA_000961 [Candida margitis]
MDNLNNIKIYLKALDQSLSQYESTLEPLLSRTLDEHLAQQPTPQDKIKFLNNFQYVLISTIYSYLKTIGIDTDNHPIKKELARVKSYMMRAKTMDQSKDHEQDNIANKEKTKEFLTQTLGVKNGVANTVKNVGPAISTQNFQGTHTKFADDDDDDNESSDDETKSKPSSKEEEEEAKRKTTLENVKRDKQKKMSKDSTKQKSKSKSSKNKVTKVKHGYLPPRSDKPKKTTRK